MLIKRLTRFSPGPFPVREVITAASSRRMSANSSSVEPQGGLGEGHAVVDHIDAGRREVAVEVGHQHGAERREGAAVVVSAERARLVGRDSGIGQMQPEAALDGSADTLLPGDSRTPASSRVVTCR